MSTAQTWLIAAVITWGLYSIFGIMSTVMMRVDQQRIRRDYPLTMTGRASNITVFFWLGRLILLLAAVVITGIAAIYFVVSA